MDARQPRHDGIRPAENIRPFIQPVWSRDGKSALQQPRREMPFLVQLSFI